MTDKVGSPLTDFSRVSGFDQSSIASGAGSTSRQVLGTTVVFGMTAATVIGIFIVPVFYVVIQGGFERIQSRRAAAAGTQSVAPPETADREPPP